MTAHLNPAQRAAVRTLKGPLLVLAGAGSGKTRVITYRICSLIKSGVPAHRILAVTFTNKAAREMRERAQKLLGRRRRGAKGPEISTFHSLCVRILRRHIRQLGYPTQFSIYDQGDQETLARGALRDIRVGFEKLRPGDLIAQISHWKSRGLDPAAALEHAEGDKQQLAALAYERYQSALKAAGAVDFDDLLLLTERLFEQFPEVRFAEASRFEHLLIDEYQDTNALQYRIVKVLAERHGNLCVVGDDDQAIYGWRGAEISHILNFANDWPKAKIIRLEHNYRSRAAILEMANRLIQHNSARHPKSVRATREGGTPPRFVRFEDETAEATAVVQEVVRLTRSETEERVRLSDIVVLFRTNEQPRAFELELRRARIPYVLVGGMSFYDRKEVRDIFAYLKVLANPQDEVSLLRIINTPARGIGTTSVQALLSRAVAQGTALWSVLPEAVAAADLPDYVGARIEAFRRLIHGYRQRLGQEPLVDTVRHLLATIDYKSELERVYKNPGEIEARVASIEELVNSVALYEGRQNNATLLGFLEEAALSGREDQRDEENKEREPGLTLMTLHSAKGLEFSHVYMVGMEEGLLPHRRSVLEPGGIQEERRLCYVGVTRAMDALTLSLAKSRMKWGKAQASIPSRFLFEMRGESQRAELVAEASAQRLSTAAPPGVDNGKPSAKQRRQPSAKRNGKRGARRTAKRTADSTPKFDEERPAQAVASVESTTNGARPASPVPRARTAAKKVAARKTASKRATKAGSRARGKAKARRSSRKNA